MRKRSVKDRRSWRRPPWKTSTSRQRPRQVGAEGCSFSATSSRTPARVSRRHRAVVIKCNRRRENNGRTKLHSWAPARFFDARCDEDAFFWNDIWRARGGISNRTSLLARCCLRACGIWKELLILITSCSDGSTTCTCTFSFSFFLLHPKNYYNLSL